MELIDVIRSNMETLLFEYSMLVESIDICKGDLGTEYIITTSIPSCMFTIYELDNNKFQVELYDEYNHIRIQGMPDITIVKSFEDAIEKYKKLMFDKVRLYNKFCKQI